MESWTCRVCSRRGSKVQLLDIDHKVCICGKSLTSRMIQRIRFWMCRRKRLFTSLIEADEFSRSANSALHRKREFNSYKCTFCPGYHIGRTHYFPNKQGNIYARC